MIKDSFNDPTILDLSEGEGMHKRPFATRDQNCGFFSFFKMLPQNTLVASHVAFTKTTEHAMGMLETLKIKQQIKKMMKRVPLSA